MEEKKREKDKERGKKKGKTIRRNVRAFLFFILCMYLHVRLRRKTWPKGNKEEKEERGIE